MPVTPAASRCGWWCQDFRASRWTRRQARVPQRLYRLRKKS